MIVEHSGWRFNEGFFCEKYLVDTNKTDHEIHWKNGKVSKQLEAFESVTADWNCDGDVYGSFGCNFEGQYAGRMWMTPERLVGLVIEGEATVKGIRRV